MYTNTQRKGVKKTAKLFSVVSIKRTRGNEHKLKSRRFHYEKCKKKLVFLPQRWSSIATSYLVRLWTDTEGNQKSPEQHLEQPGLTDCFQQKVGLNDLQRCLVISEATFFSSFSFIHFLCSIGRIEQCISYSGFGFLHVFLLYQLHLFLLWTLLTNFTGYCSVPLGFVKLKPVSSFMSEASQQHHGVSH